MGSCCTSRAVATRHIAQSGGATMTNIDSQVFNNNNIRRSDKASSKIHSGKDSERNTTNDINGSTSRRSACTVSNTSLTEAHKSLNTSNDNHITNTECTRFDETNSQLQRSGRTNVKSHVFNVDTYNEDTLSPIIVESEVSALVPHGEPHAMESTHHINNNNNKDRERKNKETNVETIEIPQLVRPHEHVNAIITHPRGLSTSTSCLERSLMVMEDLMTDTMQVSATSTTENPHSITNSFKYMNNDDLLTISSLVDVSQPTYTYNS